MAQDLWVSKATGMRRRGTKWQEVSDLIEEGISVESIYEPLASCGSQWPIEDVKRMLNRLAFDVAGVQESPDGHPIGYVERDNLADEPLDIFIQKFRPEDLIAYTAPLTDALGVLRNRDYIFVLGRKGVAGIVTRADLNKPIARMYLFSLISLLEIHMSYWIDKENPNESWIENLSTGRQDAARAHQQERKVRNQELSLLECLQFCDKADLIVRTDTIRAVFGDCSNNQLRELLKRAEDLRNNLAHSQSDLSDNSGWESILSDASEIEKILKRSDQSIEQLESTHDELLIHDATE
jgi:CBS domain